MKKISQFATKRAFTKQFRKVKLGDSDAWRDYSRKFLANNPKCYACGAPSQATDHIVAHKERLELFWKIDNYMPLCKSCHSTLTNLFDRGPVPDTEGKLRWVAEKRAECEIFTKVMITPFDRNHGRL
jgi:hypothetical protein